MSISASKRSLQIAKRNLPNCYKISVILFLIVIYQRLNAHSAPFYTPNVAHANFSAESIPANCKTQSFKFRRNLCPFVSDCDATAFKRSFHSILHTERTACRLQRRKSPCKSQNAISQISTKTLLFRSGLRYYGV
jgi:hypothetical protein